MSDLHACPNSTGWDAHKVTTRLIADLKNLQEKHGLRPDVIFFTGDAAFGHLGDGEGDRIYDQFRVAQRFLDDVRNAYDSPIERRNVYLVPGNHDVNKSAITSFVTNHLGDPNRTLDEIAKMMREAKTDWQHCMTRLDDYRAFLRANGYDHLLTDAARLFYADAIQVRDVRIGVAGFNSAWSSTGDGESEKSQLWGAIEYQEGELSSRLDREQFDFAVALIHHPSNWFRPKEDPRIRRLLHGEFPFLLHGHEHDDWVEIDGNTGHTIVAGGACYERSDGRNGYNLVTLDLDAGEGHVWLRRYDDDGRGWIQRIVHGKTDDLGRWPLAGLERFIAPPKPHASSPPGIPDAAAAETEPAADEPNETAAPIDHKAEFEKRYRECVARNLDFMELFGVPHSIQEDERT